jgi:hypothetical protein
MHFTLYRGVRDYHQTKTYGTGLWFSTSRLVALSYSNNVITKQIETDSVKIIDCKGLSWRKINTDGLARKYKDFDVIVFKNVVDMGPNAKVFNHFTPAKGSKIADYFTADTVVVNNNDLIKEDYFPY